MITWATINGAKFIGREDDLGSVEQGKLADLLIVDGDPSKDIKVLQDRDNIKAVIKNGEFITQDLDMSRVGEAAA